MTEWYYTDNGTKKGPISEDALKSLVVAGSVTYDTLVWRNGFGSHWEKMSDVEELGDFSTPPPIPMSAANNSWIWFLALVPLIGYFTETVINGNFGDIKQGWIYLGYFVVNVFAITKDEQSIAASGRKNIISSAVAGAFLVPLYIFMRNKRIRNSQAPLLVWTATFLFAVYASAGFNIPYLGLSAPTCASPISQQQIKAIFPQIPLNLAKIGVSDVKDIKSTSQQGKVSTCSAIVVTTTGVDVPITYTIEERNNDYYWRVQLGG